MVDVAWDLREHGPADAQYTVLMLPGGLCSAASYAEVMAEPALEGTRMVAATLPGHAGAAPLEDCSIENCAQVATELAKSVGADVVVGYSMGASVAFEMVASGSFTGPVVLLGISLSSKDEPAFFRGLIDLGGVFGTAPSRLLAKAAASMIGRTAVPAERKHELREDFRRNVPQDTMPALREYVSWLHRQVRPAERLCAAGVPTWVLHAEKGDGDLTDEERATLEACPHAQVVTIPGSAFFLPIEEPAQVADAITAAMGQVSSIG